MRLVPPNDPGLWTVAKPVPDSLTPVFIADEMAKLMRRSGGVGLAAPQIGLGLRLFVMLHDHRVFVVINPVILSHGRDEETAVEGCLSLDGFQRPVTRWRVITVEYRDETGKVVQRTLKGVEARLFQHEQDHLNGVCIFPRPDGA